MSVQRVAVAVVAAAVLGSAGGTAIAVAAPDSGSVSGSASGSADWPVPAAPAASATLIVAYSFGNRIPAGVDSARTIGEPGPVNEALAAAVMATRGDRSVPVYAQTEIATVLKSRYGLTDVISIDPERAADGTLVYLSTDGVAAKVAELRGASVASDSAAVVAFHDHLWRATRTTGKHGFNAFAPADVTMPSTYDPQSGQIWTTSALLYLPTDMLGRLALLK
ncbi:hypothetical protein GFY24_26045 [Nocardia sp. SYP-A9097]|uniref:hypothetical protein n=1 Tax=Nocardia sp. SYP-A9097 TaxID=2663237 RepID=UPI00129A741C|nr:hypothetical protein [Nocardia sp. SYP-A9097]MRH90859.1 hypothetical protein [Nocardia sp. SYP-A9097]